MRHCNVLMHWRLHSVHWGVGANVGISRIPPGNPSKGTVQSVWGLLKRSIMGAFHKVSVKHLDRYLDELEWRFNNRNNEFMFRDLLERILDSEALRYQELTS